jgi:membrane protein DedA with SNARE-associated domain
VVEWIKSSMESLGYAGIVFLMFLENVFPPIPSELIMPLGGFSSLEGQLSFGGVVAAGTAGSVLGAIPLYYLGRLLGEERLKQLADRYGKWLTVSSKEIDRADNWFDTHGHKAVFFCRLVPGVRSLISIPAGVSGMHLAPFLLYSTLGSAIWTAFLAYLGRLLGENYELVDTYIGPLSYVVLGLLVLAFGAWIWHRRRGRSTTA